MVNGSDSRTLLTDETSSEEDRRRLHKKMHMCKDYTECTKEVGVPIRPGAGALTKDEYIITV